MRSALTLAFVLLAPLSAFAGTTTTNATLDVRYRISGYGAHDGDYPAQGVSVSAYTRTFFGIPRVLATGETDAQGQVTLRVNVRQGRRLAFRIETDGDVAKTFPGAWNIFLRPHRETLELTVNESSQRSAARSLTLDGDAGRAFMIQDVGTRTGLLARSELQGILPSFKKVGYSFPGWITVGGTYTPWNSRVVVVNGNWNSHPEVVMHETAHTLWYQARGKWTEIYPPFTHTLSGPAGNPALAMSEGFADFFAAYAGDELARQWGMPHLENQAMAWTSMENHEHQGFSGAEWTSWGEDNEYNIACSLWDLVDTQPDAAGVAQGQDTTNGGLVPSDTEAFRLIYRSVVETRSERRLHMSALFNLRLEAVYGQGGREVLRMNGIDLP